MTEPTLVEDAEVTIRELLTAARGSVISTEAMHYSQAAVNAAQVLLILREQDRFAINTFSNTEV